jgi:hypothetical protein
VSAIVKHVTSALGAFLLVVAPDAASAPLSPDTPLQAVFDQMDADGGDVSRIRSIGRDARGELAWGESYQMMAYVAMYEATRDVKYLDRLVLHFDAVLSVRDDRDGAHDAIRGRTLPAWGSTRYTNGTRYCWIVHAGMITYPAGTFIRIVREDADLAAPYGAKADEYLSALEQTVAAFDADWRTGPGDGEGYYLGESLGKYLPLNQQNALGRTLIELHAATDAPAYLDKATRLASFFKRRLTTRDDGAYDWAYWPSLDAQGPSSGEDISHAAINADFACLAHENGIVFTAEDMERFADTFTKSISKGDGEFADTVAGTGASGRYALSVGRWLALAGYRPAIHGLVREYLYSVDPPPAGPVAMLTVANLLRYWPGVPEGKGTP